MLSPMSTPATRPDRMGQKTPRSAPIHLIIKKAAPAASIEVAQVPRRSAFKSAFHLQLFADAHQEMPMMLATMPAAAISRGIIQAAFWSGTSALFKRAEKTAMVPRVTVAIIEST